MRVVQQSAQKLYVSQSSVSNLVHGLEEELHITIFQRTPSGVVITNEGRELRCFPLLTITADPPAQPEGLLRLDRKRSRTMITCVIRNVCY